MVKSKGIKKNSKKRREIKTINLVPIKNIKEELKLKKIIALILCVFVLSSFAFAATKKTAKTKPTIKKSVIKPAIESEKNYMEPEKKVEVKIPSFFRRLSIGGIIFARYTNSHQINAIPDTFTLSQARMSIKADISKDVSLFIQPDFAALSTAGNVALADAYGELKTPYTTLRAGQFLVPFGYDSNKYKFIYGAGVKPSSFGVITPVRDYGLDFFGGIPYLPDFYYNGALVNGTGTTDNNRAKDIVGRLNYKNSYLDIGLSGYYGTVGGTTSKKDIGLDVEYKLDPMLFVLEYSAGRDVTAAAKLQDASLQVSGIFDSYEPLVRFENYDPNTDASGNAVSTLTLGLNYLLDKSSRIAFNYDMVLEETTQVDNNLLLLELQTQI